ncbi:MAG: response regulator [Bacteroidales bacterium]|nr:response regulator [Bacteroidales bacterium]
MKTDKSTHQSMLEASEIRYRRLFETAKDGILIINPTTAQIVDANPFILEILQCDLEHVTGKQLWEIGLFANKEESKKAFKELKVNRYIRFNDMPLLRRNGHTVAVEFISNVYKVDNLDVIQCNIRDISARKSAMESLQENEQLLSRTQQIAHIGSYMYYFKDDEVKWSDEMYQIFGMVKETFKLSIEAFINCIHHDDRHLLLEWISKTSGGGTPAELDFRIIRPDGSVRELHGTGILQNDASGQPHHVIGSAQDITERKTIEIELKDSEKHLKEQNVQITELNNSYLQLNEELKQSLRQIQTMNKDLLIAKNKAEESDKLKTSFLANISHEIRTPMNAIMGYSDFLLDVNLNKTKTEQFVRIIHNSCNQLLTIISDIIDISRIESGELVIKTTRVNLNQILSETFNAYKEISKVKGINLIYNARPEYQYVEIETDLNWLRQVINNLMCNAIKFTRAGDVTFGFEIKKDFTEFFVNDSGIGIDKKHHLKIFERFRKIDASADTLYGGNGLGLSISKALIEKLGGSIWLQSEPGKGSSFHFTIPLILIINKTAQEENNIKVQVCPDWSSITILIVEDDVSNHIYIEEILKPLNVRLYHAWDGINAIEIVRNHDDISIVLMDIMMPLLNGIEATRIIKLINPTLPVIALTAYANDSAKQQALEEGFDGCLSKPMQKNTLIEFIAKHLNF